MNAPLLGPTDAADRLGHLDVLRGFALLGILLVNFQYFTRPVVAVMAGADPSLSGIDRFVDQAVMALAEGKFFPLFSTLFGAGFVLIRERAAAGGGDASRLYLRRLLVLALFGAVHGSLVWAGDILLLYAVLGLTMLLFFRETPAHRQLAWAMLFIFTPPLLFWLFVGAVEASAGDPERHAQFVRQIDAEQADLIERMRSAEAVYSAGAWTEVARQTARDFGFLLSQGLFWATPVLGYFLLGRWLLTSGRLRDPDRHGRFFGALATWGTLVGGALSIAAAVIMHDLPYLQPSAALALGMSLMALGAPLLMLGYVGLVLRFRDRLAWLAPAGRMALTNYLLQSLVWTFIFYGYGLGLWDQVSRAWHPVLVIAFFVLQVMLSRWWMARFRFGPAEWVWRSLTYLQPQPMAGRA
jgi:uncharacterized protein